MRRALLAIVAAVVLGVGVALAQDDCGDGLPCGRIPWDLPILPALPSPTPMPTLAFTAIPPTPGAGTPTWTPTPTATPGGLDTGDLDNQVATLGAAINATPISINDLNGTPVNNQESFEELGLNAGTFFGYARAITSASFGEMSPLFNFGFLALLIVISVKLLTFLLPIGAVVFGILRNVISLIRDFLPI